MKAGSRGRIEISGELRDEAGSGNVPSEDTLPELGVDRAELLHVAQSLFHDHVPAKREGLPSVWINRRHDRPGWGATPEPSGERTYNLEFNSMGDFADAVDQAFTETSAVS